MAGKSCLTLRYYGSWGHYVKKQFLILMTKNASIIGQPLRINFLYDDFGVRINWHQMCHVVVHSS
jgi:hypothetical protein